jgi:DUF4097 and DUF4098 domain-containing protein YvlB
MKSESPRVCAALALAAASLWITAPAGANNATRAIDERRPASADGQIEVINVAGSVQVVGWDRAEIEVTGKLGSEVDKVDISSTGSRTTVRVVRAKTGGLSFHLSNPDAADLVLHVPQRSSLNASLVSADLTVKGLSGTQDVQTVSGDVTTSVARETHIRTVSGDVTVDSAPDVKVLEIGTVSGDLHVTGNAGGELTVSTVSGDGRLELGSLTKARLKTVSGDFRLSAGLAADGRLEAESVSGDVRVEFTGSPPPADYDLQTLSGDVSACFGPKATSERYGPGSRLVFKEGAGTAKVHVDTRSGDVTLCTRK